MKTTFSKQVASKVLKRVIALDRVWFYCNPFLWASFKLHQKTVSYWTSSWCQETYPSSNWPVRGAVKFWPEYWCQVVKFYCSIFFSMNWLVMSQQSDHQFWHPKNNLSWNIPRSMSVHFRSFSGINTRDNVMVGVGRGLASSQHLQQESLLTFRLRVCWFHWRCEPKNKFCHEMKIRSWSPHRNVLDDNRPLTSKTGPILRVPTDPPSHLGGFITPKQSILSTWPQQFVNCIIIKCNEELSFLNILRETSIGAEFGQFLLFRKICEFLLIFTQQLSLYFRISLRNSSRKFCRYHHRFQIPSRSGSHRTLVVIPVISVWSVISFRVTWNNWLNYFLDWFLVERKLSVQSVTRWTAA